MARELKRGDFPKLVIEALRTRGGGAHLTLVAKFIWDNYQEELEASGTILYTWQYDVRWAATKLRHEGKLKAVELSPRGVWELN